MRHATDDGINAGYAAEAAYFDALRRGDRVEAERHAQRAFRTAGRTASAPAGSSLVGEMTRLSAECRALAATAHQTAIANVLAGGGRRAAPVRERDPDAELDRAIDGYTDADFDD